MSLEVAMAGLSVVLNAYLVRLVAASRPVLGRSLWLCLSIWTAMSLWTDLARAVHLFDWEPATSWIRAGGLGWFLLSPMLAVSLTLHKNCTFHQPSRRRLLRAAGIAIATAPVVTASFAIGQARRDAIVREVDIVWPSLPADLDGLRIVQLSDIHLGAFYSRDQLRRVVDQANTLGADLAVVTGDLISSYGDPLEAAVQQIARLRSTAGILGCHGNHEIAAEAEDEATRLGARAGIRFLRNRGTMLRFGSAELNVAGVDYQKKGLPYLVGSEALVKPGAFNLLLSHNPDVFPVAALQGWDLTLAGHTHGGQVTLEYLNPNLNPARFYTPYIYGDYRRNDRALYVSSGIGTIGVPARLGTASEIALLRLRRLPARVRNEMHAPSTAHSL